MSSTITSKVDDTAYALPVVTAAMAKVEVRDKEEHYEHKKSHTDTIAPADSDNSLIAAASTGSRRALVIADAQIPLLDLTEIANATGDKRASLVKAFGDGLKEVGFIAIKAESLTPLIGKVYEQMELYFSQEADVKKKDIHNNNGQTGFSPIGTETAAGARQADFKETYFITPNFDKWPTFSGDKAKEREFAQVMQAYQKELTKYAAQLMGFVAEYLHEPTEDVSTSVASATNLVRLAHYPATNDNRPRAGAHCDLNALTLLPPATRPGLQLLDKQGHWKTVKVPQGYLIVNTGEQMEMKTAGKIKATLHQVVKLEGEEGKKRLASIFFASWSNDFSLKPFASCVKEITERMSEDEKARFLKKYPDVTVNENLLSRLIEMRTIKDPDEKMVRHLHGKGLLQQPPDTLVSKYPDLFGSKEESKEKTDPLILKV